MSSSPVIALTIAVYMFQKATDTAEVMLYFADETNYYDNITVEGTDSEEIVKELDDTINRLIALDYLEV